ncbi:hypothetical protein GLOIN_2v1655004 [Rhizophagus clarus]|uniref:Uncharacterized protein n=1 Tax=Rhizophagus clarus TaxID=94130 RepID=A0A8H3M7F7_9GLOM|nr:hypothetical protein GLOIN_2v1655004 [Rhizophagus clarus]
MGPVVDSNEAMRCEYISTILHTAVSLLKDLLILPQMTLTGAESSGPKSAGKGVAQNLMQCKSSCDMNLNMLKKRRKSDEAFGSEYEYVYGIVTTATDWYFILHSTVGIYCTSKTEYRISLTEDAIKNPAELRKNVKRILEVIVGLLKDRISASEEPANKKCRVEEIIKKKKIE